MEEEDNLKMNIPITRQRFATYSSDGILERNNAGKQFDEDFKRKFVQKILRLTKGKNQKELANIVQSQAEKIHVYVNQVSVWLATYKIVFKLQKQIQEFQYGPLKIEQRAEQCLIDYLNQNLTEKRYRFLKIANCIFRLLKVMKCTGDHWMKRLLNKHKMKLDPKIDPIKFAARNRRKPKTVLEPTHDNLGSSGSEQSSEVREIKKQEQVASSYKKKVIENIDKEIEHHLKEVFQLKSIETHTPLNDLKLWYCEVGRFDLFKKKPKHT